MAQTAQTCDFGWKAPHFRLPATDGKSYELGDIRGEKGTVIVFICNHCPYVRSVIDRIVRDASDMAPIGVRTAAICSNDAIAYPADSFDNMKIFAAEHRFPFPYLFDESQAVARAYGAACTPDFFGFDADLGLQYRGRLDASGRTAIPGARRELFEAMTRIAETGEGPADQTPSISCSIKWK